MREIKTLFVNQGNQCYSLGLDVSINEENWKISNIQMFTGDSNCFIIFVNKGQGDKWWRTVRLLEYTIEYNVTWRE